MLKFGYLFLFLSWVMSVAYLFLAANYISGAVYFKWFGQFLLVLAVLLAIAGVLSDKIDNTSDK